MARKNIASSAGAFNVYYISCTITGLGYVGITGWSVNRRFKRHLWNAQWGRPGALYDAMRAYGPDAFRAELLQVVSSWDDACETECLMIAELDTKLPNGLNATGGGDGNFGYEYTDEVRARMSASGSKKRLTEEHRQRIGAAHKGRVWGPEVRANMAAAKKGKKASLETREKMRQARLGKPLSATVVAKMIGRKRTQETKDKICAAKLGKKASPEACANIAAAKQAQWAQWKADGLMPTRPPSPLGTKHSAETKAKMSASWARRRELGLPSNKADAVRQAKERALLQPPSPINPGD
jgi:group I intron endonuclease